MALAGPETSLLSNGSFSISSVRGKRKKKKGPSEADSRYDSSIQKAALQYLYEQNIMDRSHLQNMSFDEFYDDSLPVYRSVVVRLMSHDLQRVEAFETYLVKRLRFLRLPVRFCFLTACTRGFIQEWVPFT